MPLSLSSGGGESKPYVRFGAQINSWLMSDADGKAVEVDLVGQQVVFDIQHVQLGWLLLAEGQRDWQPWPRNKQQPRPGDEYKVGFDVALFSPRLFGDEPVRAWSSNATGQTMAFEALYNEAEKHPEFAEGKSPVVKITGSKAIKVGKGATRTPLFEIVKWIDRPAAFAEAAAADEPPAAAPAPAPRAASKPAAVTEDEF